VKRRTLAHALVFAAALAFTACGGGSPPPEPAATPGDPGLESSWRLARFALQNGQYRQAVPLYERALSRAYARDDSAAIGDIGYEYALALLRNGQPDAAAEQARQTRAELARREAPAFAELYLVEAVALYETGSSSGAAGAAREAIALARSDDTLTRGRANFILGMIAADAGDAAGVEAAMTAIGEPANDALRADRSELTGRRSVIAGAPDAAIPAFEQAATLRRDMRDYNGMARALAAAANAAEAAGNPEAAADLYYRAGTSAAEQRDSAGARRWLDRALALATQHDLDTVAADARARLASLDK
jgi:tetratricopeptide (TPR) repeat protein